ncbi:MAG: D-sedoheptulose 7-phosphate isomerase [Frankiales bacterium]|jgi:D-sedoheptulose 7-phosphate isomerase|nr:D-sedoheptulose 7-phosphate isomerase [Frankiales bacterium]
MTKGGVEDLYPFLYAGNGNGGDVLAEVRQSTEDKVVEIAELRAGMGRRHAAQLTICAEAIANAFRAGATLYAFGNGGSSTDAQALVRLFTSPGSEWLPMPAVGLTDDVAVITALANDVGFDVVFARQLAALARSGDVAVGLSTSGGSANVLQAFEAARQIGMLTVGFAGYDGGRMAEVAATGGTIDHLFVVPSSSVHRIQEAQTTAYHVLWELTQRELM